MVVSLLSFTPIVTIPQFSLSTVAHMNMLASLAGNGWSWRSPDSELADSTLAPRVHAEIRSKLHWPTSEDEIVFAAITVILVGLFVVIAVAAAAVLTMG